MSVVAKGLLKKVGLLWGILEAWILSSVKFKRVRKIYFLAPSVWPNPS